MEGQWDGPLLHVPNSPYYTYRVRVRIQCDYRAGGGRVLREWQEPSGRSGRKFSLEFLDPSKRMPPSLRDWVCRWPLVGCMVIPLIPPRSDCGQLIPCIFIRRAPWSGLLLSTSGHGGHPDAIACAAAPLPARPAPHQEGIGCGICSN